MGNVPAIYVLRYHDIKLKKYLVDVLTALACFDILFLLTSFLLISFPNWGTDGYIRVWPGTVSLYNIFITYFHLFLHFKFLHLLLLIHKPNSDL